MHILIINTLQKIFYLDSCTHAVLKKLLQCAKSGEFAFCGDIVRAYKMAIIGISDGVLHTRHKV